MQLPATLHNALMTAETRIRLVTPDDAEAIAAIYAHYVLHTPISFEVAPPSPEDVRDRIQRISERFPYLVCELDGCITGYAYAGRHHERAAYDWSCEVSIYIDSRMHRRCLGRALYGSLLDLLRRLGYYNALAGITLPNDASIGLHTAMGFRPAGVNRNVGFKDGRWWDVAYMEMALQDGYPGSVAPPTAIGDLDAAEVSAILERANRSGGPAPAT